jgi:hypothetical protein
MATLVITRADLFPDGTSVSVYPRGQRNPGGPPSGSATDTQTVAAGGALTVTVTAGVPYVAYALVGSEHRYCDLMSSASSAGVPWKTVVANRRTAIGTS